MAALLDQQAEDRARDVLAAKDTLDEARLGYRDAYVRYIRDALKAGWSWRRIGKGVGMTDTGARRFWDKHRTVASRIGG
jgi:hypothetical protein